MTVTKGSRESGAIFSECGKYRYALWRIWDYDGYENFSTKKKILNFCMLNPSTADENQNDPTIERCVRRAKMMGFGGVMITNIFAYRSTDPRHLKKPGFDVVGIWNGQSVVGAALNCDLTICGWGKHGAIHNQGRKMLDQLIFWAGKRKIKALKINKDGSPAHPLYIGYDVKPIPIDSKAK